MTRREFIAQAIMDKEHDENTALWLFALSFVDLDIIRLFIDNDKFKAIREGLDKEMEVS